MDPLAALRATYYIVLFGIELEHVPSEVRSSLELVRTCHADLQYLIELRSELLPLLEKRPKVIERVNNIIEAAHQGLAEVCEIVEKCRPEANNGKTSLTSRLSWILWDSTEIKGRQPVISRHHASVLAELNFLRQILLLSPETEDEKQRDSCALRPAQAFENVALLGDIMGKLNISGTQGSTSPFSSHREDFVPLRPVTRDDVKTASVPYTYTSRSSFASSGPPPPYPGQPRSAVSGITENPNLSFDSNSLVRRASDLPTHNQCRPSHTLLRPATAISHNRSLDSSNTDGLSLLLDNHAGMATLPSPQLSLSNFSTLSSPNSSVPPHRPVSSMSSVSSLHDTYTSSGSLMYANPWSDSTISRESPLRGQNQCVPNHSTRNQWVEDERRGFDSLSPTSGARRGSWISAQSPRPQQMGAMPTHLAHSEGGASNYGCRQSYPGQNYENTAYPPHPPSRSNLQPVQATVSDFKGKLQLETQKGMQLPQIPYSQSSSTAAWLEQGHRGNLSPHVVSPGTNVQTTLDQVGLFEMMSPTPTTPQHRLASPSDAQKGSFFHITSAIEGYPQELSSVRYDTDPHELP